MSRPSSIVSFVVRLAGGCVRTVGAVLSNRPVPPVRRLASVGAVLPDRPALVALLAFLAPAALWAQAPPESRVPAAVRAAHEFLLAAYPDLMRQPLSVQVKPEGDVWLLSVAEAAPPPKPGDPVVAQMPTPVLLRGTIAFDGTQRLVGYQADGPYLNDAANAVLRDRVRNHPQWIQSDADVELMRMGAEATVGQTFEPRGGRPDSAGMSRHLGTSVTTAGPAAFALRAQAPDGSAPVVKAVWLVHATAADASGAAVQYQFTYEPVGGRLVGVARVGGAE